MRVETTFSAVSLLALAAATPTRTINKRATCGQWDSIQTGAYTVYNDLWGESGATSGSGCIAVNGISGNTLSWDSTWTWVGGNGVKSFPNAVVSLTPAPLSSISSMQSTWAWSYTGSNLVADVAYDMFTSSTATGSNEYEIMVWLAAYGGAGPISSSYGSDGSPVPIGSTTIAGYTFNLYKGPNDATTVYSFLPASGQITSFNGDIRQFFTYLISQGLISDSQYLTSVGAGSEPTTGSDATFAVSAYRITIATGGTVTSPSSATSRTTSTTSQVTSTTSTTHSTTKTFSTSPSTGSAVPHYGQCGGEGYSGSTVCAAPYTCTSFNAWYSQCV